MTARARGLWARLARQVAGPATPAATVDQPLVVAGFRCARCGTYCPTCTAAPAGWSTVVRPERVDESTLRDALFELEPPVDEPGVRRTRPVPRGVSTMVHTGLPAQASPATRRIHPLPRPTGGAQ